METTTYSEWERPINRPVVGRLALWAFWLPQVVLASLLLYLRKFPKTIREFSVNDYVFMIYAYTTTSVGGGCLLILSMDMNEMYTSRPFFKPVTFLQFLTSLVACSFALIDKDEVVARKILSIPILIFLAVAVLGASHSITYVYRYLYPIPMLPVSSTKTSRVISSVHPARKRTKSRSLS